MKKKKISKLPENLRKHLDEVLRRNPSQPPEGTDWELFSRYLAGEKLSGAYYYTMEKAGLEGQIPPEFSGRMRLSLNANRFVNRTHLAESSRVSRLIEENDIQIIFLKGVPNIIEIFEDVGEHPMEDVDILVRKDNMSQIKSLLKENFGYFPISVLPGINLFVQRDEHEGKVKLLRKPDQDKPTPYIHLHTMIGSSLFSYDGENFFKSHRKIMLEGNEIRVLRHEDNFIHTCIHWASHIGGRSDLEYRRMGLIRFLEKFGPVLNWEEIAGEFEYRGIMPCLTESLKAAGYYDAGFIGEDIRKKIRLPAYKICIINILEKRRSWLARYLLGFHRSLWPDRRRLTAIYGDLPGVYPLLKAWVRNVVSIARRIRVLFFDRMHRGGR
ncbi:MAG: nucleotidyltransferase family protein [Chloroflexi bacterium]|nr:nucleotidyltransferase family protein [Chloroflexota bacterium]